MGQRFRVTFAPAIQRQEREEIQRAISSGLPHAERILPEQSRVKAFYRLDLPTRVLFVKSRSFSGLLRRLGRTFRRTKEEDEFWNYASIRRAGISCPEPVSVARVYNGPLISQSLLLTEYLGGAIPLRTLLMRDPSCPEWLAERVAAFLQSLLDKGLIHDDLQWDNILVRSQYQGCNLYLVDPLHIRWIRGEESSAQKAFRQSLMWFFSFLISGGVPGPVLEVFLERLGPMAGVKDRRQKERFLERAQGLRTGR